MRRIVSFLAVAAGVAPATAQEPQPPLVRDYVEQAVTEPPASLGLDPFYAKYVDAHGIPIVTSDRVPDAALLVARDIVTFMLAKRPDIRDGNILAERIGRRGEDGAQSHRDRARVNRGYDRVPLRARSTWRKQSTGSDEHPGIVLACREMASVRGRASRSANHVGFPTEVLVVPVCHQHGWLPRIVHRS